VPQFQPPPAMKARAKVLFDFAGTGKNEMALTAGSIIDISQKGPKGGWSKGLLGAFPTDYVQFIDDVILPPQIPQGTVQPSKQSGTSSEDVFTLGLTSDPFKELVGEKKKEDVSALLSLPEKDKKLVATAKFTRAAGGPTEISLEKGDTILVLSNKDKDWWYGSIVGKSSGPGYFPSNYVEIKEEKKPENPVFGLDPIPKYRPNDLSSATKEIPVLSTISNNVLQEKRVSSDINIVAKSYKTNVIQTTELAKNSQELPIACIRASLVGVKKVFVNPFDEKSLSSVWKVPLYVDLFADAYKAHFDNMEEYQGLPILNRLRTSFDAFLEASKYVDLVKDTCSENIRRTFDKAVYAVRDAVDVCRMIPVQSGDMVRLYTFLVTFTVRIKTLRSGDFLIIPLIWSPESTEHAIFILLMKEQDANFGGYSVSVINGSSNPDSGLEYHLPHIQSTTGQVQRKLSFNFRNIPDEKVQNTAFW
jgi:hypothetical protein